MLRDAGVFTVLEFGYEKVIPELIQKEYCSDSTLIETLRVAPDFAVINQLSKEVSLVEVKYRHKLSSPEIWNMPGRCMYHGTHLIYS